VLPQLTRGFVSAQSPYYSDIASENLAAADFETINDNASTVDAWIRQRIKSLLTQISQAKT
jgi:hypothetical protein